MLLLEANRLRNSFRQREDQSHYMFGDDWPVYLTSISENDIAVHQFRKQKLMNGGGRRMNPAKALGCSELLRANRKSECYICVSKLLFNSFVGSEPHDFELRECFAKTISEPFRRNPEIEAVLSGDEEFANERIG